MMLKGNIQNRNVKTKLEIRSDENEGKFIEGYFVIFGK